MMMMMMMIGVLRPILYCHNKYEYFSSSLKNLEHCIADIRLWMTQNLLKLNDNKTNLYIWHHHIVLNP